MNRKTEVEKPKYFDLDIRGIGYLNQVREVKPEGGTPFLSATLSALQGPADHVRYTRFDCVVSGEEAKHLVRQLMPEVSAGMKVLVGFHLSDLQAGTFTLKQGDRVGETGIALKSRLLRLLWVKVEGQPYPVPAQATGQVIA